MGANTRPSLVSGEILTEGGKRTLLRVSAGSFFQPIWEVGAGAAKSIPVGGRERLSLRCETCTVGANVAPSGLNLGRARYTGRVGKRFRVFLRRLLLLRVPLAIPTTRHTLATARMVRLQDIPVGHGRDGLRPTLLFRLLPPLHSLHDLAGKWN